MRPVRGGGPWRRLPVRFLRQARDQASSKEKRGQPKALRPQAIGLALHRLRRSIAGSGAVRAVRAPVLGALGPSSGPSDPSAALHRDRGRHGRGPRDLGQLGGGGDVPGLRTAVPRPSGDHKRGIGDGVLHGVGPLCAEPSRESPWPSCTDVSPARRRGDHHPPPGAPSTPQGRSAHDRVHLPKNPDYVFCPAYGAKRTAAVAATPAGSHKSGSSQNPRRLISPRSSMRLT